MAVRSTGVTAPDMASPLPDAAASTIADRLSNRGVGDSSVPLKRSELVSEIAVMLQKMHKQSELTLEALRNLYSLSNMSQNDQWDPVNKQQSLPHAESYRSSPKEPPNSCMLQTTRPSAETCESQPEQTPERRSRTSQGVGIAFSSPADSLSLPASSDRNIIGNLDTTSTVLNGLHADIDRMLRTAEALRSYNTDTKQLYKELHSITMMPEWTPEGVASASHEIVAEQGSSKDAVVKPASVLQTVAAPETATLTAAQDQNNDTAACGLVSTSSSHSQQRSGVACGAPPPITSAMSNATTQRYTTLPSVASPQDAPPMTVNTFYLPPTIPNTRLQRATSPSTPARLLSASTGRVGLGGRASAASGHVHMHALSSRDLHELDRSSSAVGSRASPVRQLSPSIASRNLSPCTVHRVTGAASQLSRAISCTTPVRATSPTRSAGRPVSPGPPRATSPGPARRMSSQTATSPHAMATLQAPLPPAASVFEVGVHSVAGAKLQCKDWINQDAYLVVPVSHDRLVVVVFDGHGANGQHCANFAKNMFAEHALALANAGPNLENVFRTLFRSVQAGLESHGLARMAGTTATAAVIDATAGTVSTAYVGDSRLLAALGPRVYFETKDHTFDAAAESRCIEHGGEVREQTVAGVSARRVFKRGESYPGLSMSRSLGDSECHELGVLAEPTVHCCAPFWPGCTLVVASDGVWEKISSELAAVEVADLESQVGATALVDKALSYWQGDVDDITVIIVRLSKPTASLSSSSPASGLARSSPAIAPVSAPLNGNAPSRSSAGSLLVGQASPGRNSIARYGSPTRSSATVPTATSPTCSTFAPLTSSRPIRYSSPSQSSRRSSEHLLQQEALSTWLPSGSPKQSSSQTHRIGKTPAQWRM